MPREIFNLASGRLSIGWHSHAEAADAAGGASFSGHKLVLLALRGVGNDLIAQISVVVDLALTPASCHVGFGCQAANRVVALKISDTGRSRRVADVSRRTLFTSCSSIPSWAKALDLVVVVQPTVSWVAFRGPDTRAWPAFKSTWRISIVTYDQCQNAFCH